MPKEKSIVPKDPKGLKKNPNEKAGFKGTEIPLKNPVWSFADIRTYILRGPEADDPDKTPNALGFYDDLEDYAELITQKWPQIEYRIPNGPYDKELITKERRKDHEDRRRYIVILRDVFNNDQKLRENGRKKEYLRYIFYMVHYGWDDEDY